MGKCETSTAYIGVSIKLRDLIEQMTEHNMKLILSMLENGFIEDDNGSFNENFDNIVNEGEYINCEDTKKYFMDQFATYGDIFVDRWSNKQTQTLVNGCLLDMYLLVPVHAIISNDRWGYDRYGTNGSSAPYQPIQFDLDKYKNIQNYTTVFIMKQSSG